MLQKMDSASPRTPSNGTVAGYARSALDIYIYIYILDVIHYISYNIYYIYMYIYIYKEL